MSIGLFSPPHSLYLQDPITLSPNLAPLEVIKPPNREKQYRNKNESMIYPTQKQFLYRDCPHCKGTGRSNNGTGSGKCSACRGTGQK